MSRRASERAMGGNPMEGPRPAAAECAAGLGDGRLLRRGKVNFFQVVIGNAIDEQQQRIDACFVRQ